jgi:F0F1-type ATP synthase assembly protein I
MAFQMLAIILLGVFAGFKLDQWIHTKPIFTIILSIGSVILAIYTVTKDLLKKK